MENPSFIQHINAHLNKDLPGESAQMKMAPIPRNIPRGLTGKNYPVHSAVLIILFPHNNEWFFLLTERSQSVETHKGQISLPGGAREAEETLEETALRETAEELGVPSELISIIGELSPVHIPVSGFMVYPFVGWTDSRPVIEPDPSEVAKTHIVSVSELTNEKIRKRETRSIHGFDVDVPLFDFGDFEVWGATAMILSEFVEIISVSNGLKWD